MSFAVQLHTLLSKAKPATVKLVFPRVLLMIYLPGMFYILPNQDLFLILATIHVKQGCLFLPFAVIHVKIAYLALTRISTLI